MCLCISLRVLCLGGECRFGARFLEKDWGEIFICFKKIRYLIDGNNLLIKMKLRIISIFLRLCLEI